MGLFILFVYAILVGLLAKALHPGEDPVGLLSTLVVGLVGTYVGGFMQWVIFGHGHPLQTSGIIWGVIGGIVALIAWRWWNLGNSQRSFWTGKLK